MHGLATPGFILDSPVRASTTASLVPSYGGEEGGAYLNSYFPNPDATPKTAPASASRYYNITGVSSRLAILASVALLAAAAVRWPGRVEEWLTRHRRALLVASVIAVVGYGALAFTAPWLVPSMLVGSHAAAIDPPARR